MRSWSCFCIAIAAMLVAGCQPKVDISAIRAKVEEQDRKFSAAFNERNLDGVMSVYWNSPDLIGMFPDGTFRGYEGVRHSWETLFSANESVKFEFTESHLVVSPAAVYEWGTFNFSFKPKGWTEVQTTGRFLTVWEEKDNIWVITADHASPTPQPPQSADTTRH